jgi:hypothetical protein
VAKRALSALEKIPQNDSKDSSKICLPFLKLLQYAENAYINLFVFHAKSDNECFRFFFKILPN